MPKFVILKVFFFWIVWKVFSPLLRRYQAVSEETSEPEDKKG